MPPNPSYNNPQTPKPPPIKTGVGGLCLKCGVHYAWEKSLQGFCYWCENPKPVKKETKR